MITDFQFQLAPGLPRASAHGRRTATREAIDFAVHISAAGLPDTFRRSVRSASCRLASYGPVSVVPLAKQNQLPQEILSPERHRQQSGAFILQRQNEAFNHGDAAMLADRGGFIPVR